jgi:polyhydroxyalkanoate synthase
MAQINDAVDMWTRWTRAMVDEGLANFRRMARLPSVAERARAVQKGATPFEVVYEQGKLTLRHYQNQSPIVHKTPLVFVFALVNRPYILDLRPGKSVVEHFIHAGFDTYLVDWGVPDEAERHLTLDDYINGALVNVVDYLCERTGSDRVNILGYCMGGTMSAMFTALHPECVRNLMLLAAGIDFSGRDGLLQLWTDERYFDVDAFVDTYGNAPAEFLQAAFLMLKPVQNLMEKPIAFWERVEDDRYVDDFLSMEAWLNDNIPVPGEVFREFVKYLYQQNRLVQNRMPVGKHTVDLRQITCPVLNIMARRDDLVPCSQSAPFSSLVGSTDRQTIEFEAGHIGLAVGSRAQKELWPQAVEWLADRSESLPPGAAQTPGRA